MLAELTATCGIPVAFVGQVDKAHLSQLLQIPKIEGAIAPFPEDARRPSLSEDFDRHDRMVRIAMRDRQFSHRFPPLACHVSVWLLPPIGTFPRQPPAPVDFVAFSDTPGETYLVDVKVCAVADTCSGLKLVIRKALRQ